MLIKKNNEDELLDIVDDQDNIVGKEYRSRVWMYNIKNVRTINAFLINDKNKFWIPKRNQHKKIFPLALDFSVGGYVLSGETYEEAFIRETYEELELDISTLDYSFLFKLTPYEHNVSSFMHVYCIKTNNAPNYNKNDFESYYWVTINEIETFIKNGITAKDDLLPVLEHIKKYGMIEIQQDLNPFHK